MTREARRQRAVKCAAIVVAGVIIQTAIILLFVFLVLRVRHIRVRVASSPAVEGLALNYSSANPSFSMAVKMQVNIRNPNFGHYKFGKSNLMVSYRGIPVGQAMIEKAKAGAFSTKKVKLTVAVNSTGVVSRNAKMKMRKDLYAGKVTLRSQAELTGKVHVFEIFRRKKSAGMNCTMDVNIKSKAIQNLTCH
ncbi:hypothetical protein CDL15_Pgr023016 [Punica granatum]|nr:hypothetical protein CDL15_Pgr023016 [Punica granatum]